MSQHISNVLDYLNSLILADEKAMDEIFHFHVPCNDSLTDHPTAQVGEDGIGVIGIINGMFGTNSDGTGKIAACFSESDKLMCFVSNEKHKRLELVTESTSKRVQVFDTIHLENQKFDSLALDLLNKDFCIKNVLIPVEFQNMAATLVVAMEDPTNLRAIDDMKFYTGFNIAPRKATNYDIIRAIVLNYEKGHVNDAVAAENAACMKIVKQAVVQIGQRLAEREVVEISYGASEEKLTKSLDVKEIRDEAIRDCIRAIATERSEWNENNSATHIDLAIETLRHLLD